MSIAWLPRQMGLIVRCNADGCSEKFHTAQIFATHARGWLASRGWGRGLRKATKTREGTKRHDYCPQHMLVERELFKQKNADRETEKRRRDELKKAKASGAPLPKKPRKKSGATTPNPTSSPSADSAPAPV